MSIIIYKLFEYNNMLIKSVNWTEGKTVPLKITQKYVFI